MFFENPFVLLFMGLVLVVVGCWVKTHFFSDEAKAERRRRRSNAPIRSDAKRPMVKFSVKTRKNRRS